MAPGKGAHLVLNEEVLEFISDALNAIENQYNDELHDADPKAVIANLVDGDWSGEKDNFGTKAFRTMPYKGGELRVTVVLTKQDELRLDIREWFDPDA